mmetsp:Transcript_9981/g.22362  ORF Transcript_9981/g.22362 Transcript_9981/m.22362 type:complete len:105 (+) Transcript_9981:222-536(+)
MRLDLLARAHLLSVSEALFAAALARAVGAPTITIREVETTCATRRRISNWGIRRSRSHRVRRIRRARRIGSPNVWGDGTKSRAGRDVIVHLCIDLSRLDTDSAD